MKIRRAGTLLSSFAFAFAVALLVLAFFACGGDTTKPQGGLVLILTTDLSLSDMNTFRVEVSQETSPGSYGAPLIAKDYAMPVESSLPATLTIASGKAASQNVLVRAIGRKVQGTTNTPIVLREVEVRVPTDRVAALTMILSAACAGQVKTDATGRYVTTCPNAHESCQPTTGKCGGNFVDVDTLPLYDQVRERDASLPIVAIGEGGIVDVGPNVKEIQSFVLAGVTGTISGTDIFVSLPPGTNDKNIAPTIKWLGAKIEPDPSLPQSFDKNVQYTVTARDGSELVYTVHVALALPDTKAITSFTVAGAHTTYGTDDSIDLDFPFGTIVTRLTPLVTFVGKRLDPPSGVEQDFSAPVKYTVTAYDDSTREYVVSAVIAAADEAKITSFKLNGVSGDVGLGSVKVSFPNGIDLGTKLTPEIQFIGSKIAPLPSVPQDFSAPVTYAVTSADGTVTEEYEVTVERPTVSNPTFSPMGGSYGHTIGVKLSCITPGAEVRYLLALSGEPDLSSLPYTTPIPFEAGVVAKPIRARCLSPKFAPAQQTKQNLYTVNAVPLDTQDELPFPVTKCGLQASPLTFVVTNNTGSAQSYSLLGAAPSSFDVTPTSGTLATGTTTFTVTPHKVPDTLDNLEDIAETVSLNFGVAVRTVTLRQPVSCPP